MSLFDIKGMQIEVTDGDGAEYRGQHQVVMTADPATDTFFDVLLAMKGQGFFRGAKLSYDPTAICRRVLARIGREDIKASRWYWNVDWNFATKLAEDPAGMSDQAQKDPTKRPAKYRISQAKYTSPATKDQNGDPVDNSAGFALRPDDPHARLRVSVERTVRSFDPEWSLDTRKSPNGFLFSRNLTTWSLFGPYADLLKNYEPAGGKALIDDLAFGLSFENGETFIEVHTDVLIDGDLHRLRLWDEGYIGWEDEDDEELGFAKVQLLDPKTGMYPSQPLPLDGKGVQLAFGKPLVELVFQLFPQRDWGKLTAAGVI